MLVRRIAVVVLLACGLLAGGTGCVAVPQPISATEPDRPALSKAQAVKVLANLHSVMARADRTRSRTLAATVLTDDELDEATGIWSYARQTGGTGGYDASAVVVRTVVSTSAQTYPQRAVVLSAYAAPKDKAYTAVHDLVRADAGSPWKLTRSAGVATASLPAAAPAVDGVTVFPAATSSLGGIAIAAMSTTVADALNHPGSPNAKRFAKDPYATQFPDLRRGHADHESTSMVLSPATGSTVLPGAGGSALVLVPASYVLTFQLDSGWYVTLKKPLARKFPGKYQSQTYGGQLVVPVSIPRSGRPSVLEGAVTGTSFSAVAFT